MEPYWIKRIVSQDNKAIGIDFTVILLLLGMRALP